MAFPITHTILRARIMDKILDVTRQDGVARITFASGEMLKVPAALYLERRLRPGETIDPSAYRQFMLQRGYPHALEMAVKYLVLRERSVQEIRTRLRRSCYDEAVIERVLDTLDAHALVSDTRFAEQWVHHRSRQYGRRRIAQELRLKGVGGEEAAQALSALTAEDEQTQADKQAQKLARRMNDRQKVMNALVRRGYDFAVARRAAERALAEPEA